MRVTAELRYRGQAFELAVEAHDDAEELREAFHAAHEEAYGFRDPEGEVELVTLRATATEPGPDVDAAAAGAAAEGAERSTRTRDLRRRGARGGRDRRRAGARHGDRGPGARRAARGDAGRPARLGRRGARVRHDPAGEARVSVDPITLRVVSGALRAACEEMGAVLVKASHSANIKERRDASCALFDAEGQMVMQAEHIPVHLGAMPDAVAAVAGEDHADGTPWVLNDPFAGGTHLPDITVITPVLDDGELLGFAASRAHHADVGGPTPGSMPADSTTLEDEGVVISPRRLDDDAIERAGRRRCASPPSAAPTCAPSWPPTARAPSGWWSCASGSAPTACATRWPRPSTTRSAGCAPAWPSSRTATREARDVLEAADGDLELCLKATIDGDELTLDFTGSADQHGGNLNCPMAVTRSACWFAVRVLTDPDIPPAAGAMRPVTVIAPEGSLLNARSPGRGGGGQRRDLLARRRPRAGRVRPRARPGHDEQPHARQRRLRLLRDARRRPGRLPGRRRPERRARRDVEHAQHAGRGARARVPAARRRATRLRRGSGGDGRAPRRRRRRARARGAAPTCATRCSPSAAATRPPGADGGEPGARGRNLLDGEELAPEGGG